MTKANSKFWYFRNKQKNASTEASNTPTKRIAKSTPATGESLIGDLHIDMGKAQPKDDRRNAKTNALMEERTRNARTHADGHIGASQISILLDENKYTSRDDLLKRKRFARFAAKRKSTGSQKPQQSNRHAIWGQRLENVILEYLADDFPDYTPNPEDTQEFWIHGKTRNFAAMPDSVGHCNGEETRGVFEIKTVQNGRSQGKNGHTYGKLPKDGSCPREWFLQIQAQLSCSDFYLQKGEARMEWGVVVCLDSGNRIMLWHIPRDDKVISKINYEVNRFWKDLDILCQSKSTRKYPVRKSTRKDTKDLEGLRKPGGTRKYPVRKSTRKDTKDLEALRKPVSTWRKRSEIVATAT